jgi:hypothetical protein
MVASDNIAPFVPSPSFAVAKPPASGKAFPASWSVNHPLESAFNAPAEPNLQIENSLLTEGHSRFHDTATEIASYAASVDLQDTSSKDFHVDGIAEDEYIHIVGGQESLKLVEAELIGEPDGAPVLNNAIGAAELPENVDSNDFARQRQVGQNQEPTPAERKAKRKAAIEVYERMKDDQRLKTERGNTVRAINTANLISEAGPSDSDDSDSDDAIASSANPETSFTRLSLASMVAAAPTISLNAEKARMKDFFRMHSLSVVFVIALVAISILFFQKQIPRSEFTDGDLLLANNRPSAAVEKLTMAIASNPRLVGAYIARADAYSQTGATDLALADCRKAVELEPNKPEAYEIRARILLPLGNLVQAFSDRETASRLRGR